MDRFRLHEKFWVRYNSLTGMLSILYRTIIDALFPLSPAEQELFSWSPEEAYVRLPPAPDFSGLAVPLPGARSVFAYKDERVSRLVWNIKYKKSAHAVKIGGYALYGELMDLVSAVPQRRILVIPIPITQKRRRERGYNQCELLLDEAEKLEDKPRVSENQESTRVITFEKNLLMRTGNSSEQKRKNREGRVESAHDLFAVRPEIAAPYDRDMPVVVIDDVITTGSTMYEAIETLKKAGFENVRALSLAH